jgi:hypothetical protein
MDDAHAVEPSSARAAGPGLAPVIILVVRQVPPAVHGGSACAQVLNCDSWEWFPGTGDSTGQTTREVPTKMTMAIKARP